MDLETQTCTVHLPLRRSCREDYIGKGDWMVPHYLDMAPWLVFSHQYQLYLRWHKNCEDARSRIMGSMHEKPACFNKITYFVIKYCSTLTKILDMMKAIVTQRPFHVSLETLLLFLSNTSYICRLKASHDVKWVVASLAY